MRRKKIDKSPLAAVAAAAPWWFWLVLVVPIWLVAKGMIGTMIGYLLAVMGPLVCVRLAIASARQRMATPRQQASRYERSIPQSDRPSKSTPGPDLYEEWKRAGESDAPIHVDTSKWNRALLKSIEWRRLEQVAAAYFRSLGFRVEEGPAGPDGGIDLRLFAGTSTEAGVLVQCKAWASSKVGVRQIRELFGVMAGERVSEGIFLTTSSFTNEAVEWARGKNITLIDGSDFLRKLLDLPPEDQARILEAATSGDFTTPSCPSCRVKMMRRTAQGRGDSFWGCTHFPKCRSTIRIGRSEAAV